MKIVITGHTSGIGKAAKQLLDKEVDEKVIGLSRSTGFDIEKKYKSVLKKILDSNADVFINNAYIHKKQTQLLKDVYNKWKFKNKLIINIGSIASLTPQGNPDYYSQYATDKREQREFCEKENFLYSKKNFNKIKCGITNINCDYVNTPFKTKYIKNKFPNLDPVDVAAVIHLIIESFSSNICIREINLHSTLIPKK